MGLFDSGGKSDREILDENNRADHPSKYDIEAIVGTLDNDSDQIRHDASVLLNAAANEVPDQVAPHVGAVYETIADPDQVGHAETLWNLLFVLHETVDPDSEAGANLVPAVLQYVGVTAEGVRTLVLAITRRVVTAREGAAAWLAREAPRDRIEGVAAALTAEEIVERDHAVAIMREVGTVDASVCVAFADELVARLAEDNDQIVFNAVAAVMGVADEQPERILHATDDLLGVLRHHPEYDAQHMASISLARIAQTEPERLVGHTDLFAEQASTSGDMVRVNACITLGYVARADASAVAPHRDVLEDRARNDGSEEVREFAQKALNELG